MVTTDQESVSELVVLETEASMVTTTDPHRPTTRLAYFLLPTTPTSPLPRPLKPITPDPDLFTFKPRSCPHTHFLTWLTKLSPIYKPLWLHSGIADAIHASTYTVRRDPAALSGALKYWNPATNSFHFRWSEATVTLEDVIVLGGFNVLGAPVRTHQPLTDKTQQIVQKMVAERKAIVKLATSNKADHTAWIKHFMGGTGDEIGTEIEHVAFLALWLTKFVFPDSVVSAAVFPLAVRLAGGERVALAPAVLAGLYRDLGSMRSYVSGSGGSRVLRPFRLLQLWLWERFSSLRPERENHISADEPRVARWHDVGTKTDPWYVESVFKLEDEFQWRPYAIGLDDWSIPGFYVDEGGWYSNEALGSFVRCLRACELVGIDCIEQYLPHRVAMQFGLDQDIPASVPRANSSWEVAWESYDISQKKVRFYVPPRLFESDVAHGYLIWWKQYMKKVRGLSKKKKKRKLEDVYEPAFSDRPAIRDCRTEVDNNHSGTLKSSLNFKLTLRSKDIKGKGSDNSRQTNVEAGGKLRHQVENVEETTENTKSRKRSKNSRRTILERVDDTLVPKNGVTEKVMEKMNVGDSSCNSINVVEAQGKLLHQVQNVVETAATTKRCKGSDNSKETNSDRVDGTLVPKDCKIEKEMETMSARNSSCDLINVVKPAEGTRPHQGDGTLVSTGIGFEKEMKKMSADDSSCDSINVVKAEGTLPHQVEHVEETTKSTKRFQVSDSYTQIDVEGVDDTLLAKDSGIEKMNAGDSSSNSMNIMKVKGTVPHQVQNVEVADENIELVEKESELDRDIRRLKKEISIIGAKIVDLESQLAHAEVHTKPEPPFSCSS